MRARSRWAFPGPFSEAVAFFFLVDLGSSVAFSDNVAFAFFFLVDFGVFASLLSAESDLCFFLEASFQLY